MSNTESAQASAWPSPAIDPEYDAIILPMPVLAADAKERDLPVNVLRKCCAYKSCGNAELYLHIHVDPATAVRTYSYRRLSNDEDYFGPSDLPGIIERLNYRLLWPVDEDAYDRLATGQLHED